MIINISALFARYVCKWYALVAYIFRCTTGCYFQKKKFTQFPLLWKFRKQISVDYFCFSALGREMSFHERVIACTVFTWKFKQDISHVEISVGATITALKTKSPIENCLILSTLQIFVKTYILDENLSLDACWFFLSSKQCFEIGWVSGREKWFTARDNIEECSSASVMCKVMQIFSGWMLYGFL